MVTDMNTSSQTQPDRISSTDRRRQLEESISQAMARYRSDFEAVRANSARLRAQREAMEAEIAAQPPQPKKAAKPAKTVKALKSQPSI